MFAAWGGRVWLGYFPERTYFDEGKRRRFRNRKKFLEDFAQSLIAFLLRSPVGLLPSTSHNKVAILAAWVPARFPTP